MKAILMIIVMVIIVNTLIDLWIGIVPFSWLWANDFMWINK